MFDFHPSYILEPFGRLKYRQSKLSVIVNCKFSLSIIIAVRISFFPRALSRSIIKFDSRLENLIHLGFDEKSRRNKRKKKKNEKKDAFADNSSSNSHV